MRRRDIPWLAWLTVAIGTFAALETRAIWRGDIPTLSESLAGWLGSNPRRSYGHVGPWAFLAFWVWLAVHIARWETLDNTVDAFKRTLSPALGTSDNGGK